MYTLPFPFFCTLELKTKYLPSLISHYFLPVLIFIIISLNRIRSIRKLCILSPCSMCRTCVAENTLNPTIRQQNNASLVKTFSSFKLPPLSYISKLNILFRDFTCAFILPLPLTFYKFFLQ